MVRSCTGCTTMRVRHFSVSLTSPRDPLRAESRRPPSAFSNSLVNWLQAGPLLPGCDQQRTGTDVRLGRHPGPMRCPPGSLAPPPVNQARGFWPSAPERV